MAHQSKLENRKYRNWVKTGLGLKFTKEGLEPFCDQLVKQQHVGILNKVKQKHNLSAVTCGNCDIKTLQPDHVCTRSKQCPLGQINCNCQHRGGKTSCSVCGAIYDEIIKLHASTPPSPYWKNTDTRHWCTEPWAVAKCFINAAGYDRKLKVSEFDCSGLLHILINNIDFRDHLNCTTDGTDLLQKVLKHRNMIYHSHDMELGDEDMTTYIDDMIVLLQDDKELIDMEHSKAAVEKLKALKGEDFVITTTNEIEIHRAVMADVDRITEEVEKQKLELEQTGKEVREQVARTGNRQISDLDQTGKEVRERVSRNRNTQITDLLQKGKEVRKQVSRTRNTQITDLEQKRKEVREQVVRTGNTQITDLEQTGKEVREQVIDRIARTGNKQITDIEQKGLDIQENVKSALTEKGNQVKDEIVRIGTKVTTELKQDITAETIKTKLELEQKQKEMMAQFETKLDVKLEQKVKGDQDYNHNKTKFQKKLVDNYRQYALKVSTLPFQKDKNQTDIANMYASPWMVVKLWDESSKQMKEIKITLDEIFSNEEKLSKYIYIVGEAGSGKSALCKYLVYYWCLAHRELATTTIKSEVVKKMEKYNFLFYISLRHFTDFSTIENMLDEIYPDPILRTILQNESDNCLMILDGLDEWTPQNQQPSQFLTPGLPARDLHAEYTIITTTRRWKFDSLHITDSEIHKKIQLKGITDTAIKDLTKTTVNKLNEIFHKNKVAEDFEPDLQRSPVADLSHVPMVLQQLICLWFDGKLRGTSKCSVYSSMLNLFFDLKVLKHCGNQVQMSSVPEIDSKLPEYLFEYQACCDNTSVIYYLSRLAYTTLFNRNTKDTLTFSNSTFKQLKIPDDVKTCSLNAGILSEHLTISLFASTRKHSSFSFVHKSMQEFLAAVHIAMHFEKTVNISDMSRMFGDNFEENCKQCIRTYFRDWKTVVDILEQSNVFIMLCGLEPKLLPYITEYIFNVMKIDEQMIEERITLEDIFWNHKNALAEYIQKFIISCIQEASLGENFSKNSIYIADIVLRDDENFMPYYLDKQIFNLHSVVSLFLDGCNEDTESITLKLLTECDSLKTFKYSGRFSSVREIGGQDVEIISRNKTTLICLIFIRVPEQICKTLVQIMPAMRQLISIRISDMTLSHEICTSLCTCLEQSVHLQHIRLNIICEENDKHLINLAQHTQLKYINVPYGNIYVTSFNTNSLHTCKVCVSSSVMMNQLCDSLYNERQLKCLTLSGSTNLLYNAADYIATENLIRLLPTLTSLSTVELSGFSVTDNIITRPSDMKNLKEIQLLSVTMRMTAWCKFVDSLTEVPQNVNVYTYSLDIKGGKRYLPPFPEERQYVREKTDYFRVTCDDATNFAFVSKKT